MLLAPVAHARGTREVGRAGATSVARSSFYIFHHGNPQDFAFFAFLAPLREIPSGNRNEAPVYLGGEESCLASNDNRPR